MKHNHDPYSPDCPRLLRLRCCADCAELLDLAFDVSQRTKDGGHLCAECADERLGRRLVARDTWWRRLRLWWHDRRDPQADWVDEARCTRAWERDGGYGR